jgi:hypothetical protein
MQRRYSTMKLLALFGIVGPPIGALTLLLQDPLPLSSWPGVFLFAYIYAGLPALVTGCSSAIARAMSPGLNWRARTVRFVVPVLVGPVTSLLFSLVTIASEPDVFFAVAGVFAALVCTALAELLLPLRPNNSFKPTPLRGTA